MFDLLVKDGLVVTPEQVAEMDIGVVGERIAALGKPGSLPGEARRTLNAKGLAVVPGGIEPHCHLALPVPEIWTGGKPGVAAQSVEAGTRAALFGGTTTVLDFTEFGGSRLPLETIETRLAEFKGKAHTDFAFHCILSGAISPKAISQLGEAIRSGTPTFKIFTTFSRLNPPLTVKDGHLLAAMQEVTKHGGMMVIHAEDDELVEYTLDKMVAEKQTAGHLLHLVHSKLSEDIAFRKVIRLAKHAGAPVYFVHTTAKEGAVAVAEARAQGQPVYAEALHNYLVFTSENYKEPDGPKYHTYPALKLAEDRDALGQAAASGAISTIATDEYTTRKDVKLSGRTIEDVCGGHNGIETRMMVAYTELVAKRGASLQRFAEVASTNAARILGLYPRKGVIAPGSDADLALLDTGAKKKLALADLHADTDYSIWEGYETRMVPVTTVLRGKVVVEKGRLVETAKGGQFIPRKVAPEVRARPVC
ncbi:MAG: amidohydrolase family protein [SAR202 cluster bacterium]|nr:amidohydrolase family protein [SAR202 cluster bacterium]